MSGLRSEYPGCCATSTEAKTEKIIHASFEMTKIASPEEGINTTEQPDNSKVARTTPVDAMSTISYSIDCKPKKYTEVPFDVKKTTTGQPNEEGTDNDACVGTFDIENPKAMSTTSVDVMATPNYLVYSKKPEMPVNGPIDTWRTTTQLQLDGTCGIKTSKATSPGESSTRDVTTTMAASAHDFTTGA